MKIETQLPFAFCAYCENREIVDRKLYAAGRAAEIFTTCEHADICRHAIMEMKKCYDYKEGTPVCEK